MAAKRHFFVHVNDRDTCGYCRGDESASCHVKQPHEVIDELDKAFAEAQGILLSHLTPLKIHPRRGQ